MISIFNIDNIVRNKEGCPISFIVNINSVITEHLVEYNKAKHTRGISIIGDYIVKFDIPVRYGIDSDLYKQSIKEQKTWALIEEKDRIFFPKLLFCNLVENYTIHKRIIIRNSRPENIIEVVDKVKELISKYDMHDVIADIRKGKIIKHNWGFANNKPIIFDYAV